MALGENNMKISQEGIALIKKFEGCKLESYLCAANVPTIGYGSTKGVKMGMNISQEQAEELLIVCALTPTPKDDNMIKKLYSVIELLALNILKAKDK